MPAIRTQPTGYDDLFTSGEDQIPGNFVFLESNNARRGGDQDQVSSFMDSSLGLDEPLFGSDLIPPGHLPRFRGYRRSPGGLEEDARDNHFCLLLLRMNQLVVENVDGYVLYRVREGLLEVIGVLFQRLTNDTVSLGGLCMLMSQTCAGFLSLRADFVQDLERDCSSTQT
ncbi:hypothetical protein J5N97_009892 [Dioscorea zingiberensis]|uniref:Uncharacterized protein n=1 Tax=Dioscorea zingiberensis TaxID=325984 RepID=A0A9D5CZ58_9LILI|nr:hypothetical protein J5N97_009892 [Dioscorea zingiberensis]